MPLAHDVAKSESPIPSGVAASLRQRLGAHRMDLWFGSDAKWTITEDNVLNVEVASEFVADCITRMFRVELVQSIEEVAGPGYGYRVSFPSLSPAGDNSKVESVPTRPNSPLQQGLARQMAAGTSPQVAPIPTAPIASSPTVSTIPAPSNNPSPVESEDFVREEEPVSIKLHRGNPTGPPGANCFNNSTDSSNPASRQEAMSAVDRLAEIRRENERRWDDFVQGEHNRLAYTAATMVLEKPGQITPLFIHGPHGSGKSHLAIGLAHKLRSTYKMRRVLVLTGEQFTIEFTESARGGGFANFRRKYRDVDVLVIDDLQFCLGKSGTLSELRNTIDMLLRDRRQVILVADRSLNELNGLTSDLHARLAGGMTCGIEPVDAETRVKLLDQLCKQQAVELPASTVRELATQAAGDARILQGIAHRLVAQQRMYGGTLNHELAIRCTLDLVRASQPVVRMNDIERVVCETFGLDDKALRAKTKCQSVSQPRMLAMFLSRKYTRAALSEIGEYFGNRQHSTVISAQKKVEVWLGEDEVLQCGRGKLTVKEIIKNLESTLRVS